MGVENIVYNNKTYIASITIFLGFFLDYILHDKQITVINCSFLSGISKIITNSFGLQWYEYIFIQKNLFSLATK